MASEEPVTEDFDLDGLLDSVEDDAAAAALEARLAAKRRENARLKTQLAEAGERIGRLEALGNLTRSLDATPSTPAKWLTPKKPAKGHHATLVAMLTDTHFDEVVDPVQMGGMNAYNRDIATMRLKRWAERLIMLKRDYGTNVTVDGMVLLYGGDIFSGDIHEELKRTNDDQILGSVLYWEEQVESAIGTVLDEFGTLHMAATYGNHPRLTHKPWAKLEARNNFDWYLAKRVERYFANDDRITFDVPEERDTYVTVYDTGICLNHGNETSGGSGVGGIWPPIMRMKALKRQRDASRGITWDVLTIGHWHQDICAPQQGLIVSGAMKGYDEYARRYNFSPERPAQTSFLVTPEHKITDGRPILVGDRKAEGW